METVFRCLKINFWDAAAIKEGFCAVVVGLGGVQVLDGFGVAVSCFFIFFGAGGHGEVVVVFGDVGFFFYVGIIEDCQGLAFCDFVAFFYGNFEDLSVEV